MVMDFGETIISVIIAIAFTTIGIFVGFLVKSGKHNPIFIAFSLSWIILFLSGIIYKFVAQIFLTKPLKYITMGMELTGEAGRFA